MRLDKVDSGLQIFYCPDSVASPKRSASYIGEWLAKNVGSASHPEFQFVWKYLTVYCSPHCVISCEEKERGKRY